VKVFPVSFAEHRSITLLAKGAKAMTTQQLLDQIAELELPPVGDPVVPAPCVVAFFIRWSRGLKRWKKTTLADFAGVSLSTIERAERGEKVSFECLDRIAAALGYECGYFTKPRPRRSVEDAIAALERTWGTLEPVKVRPLRTQNQIREIGNCDCYLIHNPDPNECIAPEIGALTEWFDVVSMITSDEEIGASLREARRRRLYKKILDCVQYIERQGFTVLSGVMESPVADSPSWKVAIISITPKSSDPGAIKRRVLFVDRRYAAFPKIS
jgi:transcriptional regulator with XRE-family HTH domain